MGTRSLVIVKDNEYANQNGVVEEGAELLTIYRQYDGYPTGMGQDIKEFFTLNEKNKPSVLSLTDGIGDEKHRIANGMGCLAAQLVARLKIEAGNVYIYPTGTRDCGEEYIYTLYTKDNRVVRLKVESGCVTFFGMPGTKQNNMNVLYDGPVLDFDANAAKKLKSKLDSPPNDFIGKDKKKVDTMANAINIAKKKVSMKSKKNIKTVVVTK